MIDIETIHIIFALIMGFAVGYFTAVVGNFFQEKEDETV